MEADFRSLWAGSFYVSSFVFGDVTQGPFAQIAFNFAMSMREQFRVSEWVESQRRNRVTWDQITRLLQIEYQDKGDVVHRIVERKKSRKAA